MNERHEGGCLCGEVRFAVTGLPLRVTYCTCRFCQKMTGTSMNTLVGFLRENLEILRGEPTVHTHVSEGSGKEIYMHSCQTCTSTILLTLERFPDAAGVLAGSFDDPNWFPRSPENSKYIFTNAAQHGTFVRAGYPVFLEHVADLDGTPCEPTFYENHHMLGEVDASDA